MNPTEVRKVNSVLMLVLPLFVLLIVSPAAKAQAYTPEETSCYNMVQGKVAWNTAGNTSWNEVNVRNLCKGTTKASATVNCFKAKIASGVDWAAATAACSPSALSAQPRRNTAALLQEQEALPQNKVLHFPDSTRIPTKFLLKNGNANGARLRVFRTDQPNEQNPVAESGTIANGNDIETALPLDTPTDKLVVEVQMEVAGGHVGIYRGTLTDDGGNYFCFQASGTAYIPSAKPCQNTQAVEAKRISFKNESGLIVKMNLDYHALDNTVKRVTTDDTVLGMSRAIHVPRDADPGQAMTLTVNGVGTLMNSPIYATTLLPSAINDSTCFKAWGPVITPKASPCAVSAGARTIKLTNNSGYNTMMEVVYNDGGEKTVRTNIIELLHTDTIEIPYSAPNVPIQVKFYSDPPLKVFSTSTLSSNFTGELCYRTEGTIFVPVVSNCDNSVGDAASSDVRQIRFQNDSGFDAQMTVMYFTNEMINGTPVPMLKTAVSGFINGLGGKFRLINIPKETSANMPITVSLRGSATVKDAIFSTNLPANFVATPQPCFKVWGTLFNPGGGTCNQ